MKRHRAPHGVAPVDVPYVFGSDPGPREVAAYQAMARDWVWMWSPWRRAWTAIARFGPRPLILDNPNPHALLARCRAAEMSSARHPPPRRHDLGASLLHGHGAVIGPV